MHLKAETQLDLHYLDKSNFEGQIKDLVQKIHVQKFPKKIRHVCKYDKIRDLFKVKLYKIRSETKKREREREREGEREKKRERERERL